MNVVDICSGLGGWSEANVRAGDRVTRIELNPKFAAVPFTIIADATTFDYDSLGPIDLILASPPCEKFSVLCIGRNWTHDGQPKNPEAAEALILARKIYEIAQTKARFFAMENPRAKLRALIGMPTATVWYCRYGDTIAKPTDIWTNIPAWVPRPQCKNGGTDHEAAPAGSSRGLQGRNGPLRALIPYQLSEEIREATLRSLL